jgi:hypothetical protein
VADDGEAREPLVSQADMAVAARRLNEEVAARNRSHLNEVAEAVFLTHAGQPADQVLAVLLVQSTTSLYRPTPETMMPVARAISLGRRFALV